MKAGFQMVSWGGVKLRNFTVDICFNISSIYPTVKHLGHTESRRLTAAGPPSPAAAPFYFCTSLWWKHVCVALSLCSSPGLLLSLRLFLTSASSRVRYQHVTHSQEDPPTSGPRKRRDGDTSWRKGRPVCLNRRDGS